MNIILTKDDLFPCDKEVHILDLTLNDFAIPQKLVSLATEISFSDGNFTRVFKDLEGTYE